jgi:acyl-CoA dehydrogenase
VRDGDGYVINGHKWYSSNGSIADFLIVMAVTDPDAPPHKRASMFVVPVATPGVQIVRDVGTMEHPESRFGMLGGHTEIVYDEVRVGHDALLGEEGEGFVIAQHRLVPGRIHHCMRWLGIAQRAFDMMCERSLYRPVRGGLLRDKQTAQNWIADSSIQIQAARLMTLHAAWKIDTQGSSAARVDVSRIKVFGAQMLYDVVDRALQLHGGLGFSTDMPLEAMYRFARHARFVDGADEVHRESIARQILKGYQAPEDRVPTEYLPVRREQARLKFAGLLDALALDEPGVVAS